MIDVKLLGIDVSSYQGKPNWNKVAKKVKVAILRIHQATTFLLEFTNIAMQKL